jgi:CHASE3 domain sensor protein
MGDLNLRNAYAAGEAVEHSEAVKVTLQQVLLTTIDAETGERGFIITGENSYLEPYDRARAAIADDIARLQA